MFTRNVFKSILALASTALLTVSCNVDFVGNTFSISDAGTAGVSFVQKVISDTELPAGLASYDIIIGRSITESSLTVNIETTLPAGICPSSVTFAAGQSEAPITIDLSNVAVGNLVKGTIKLVGQPEYANDQISVSLQKAYSWSPYGTCSYTDDIVGPLFGASPITYEVEVEKADGFDVYRLIDPYGEVFPYNDPGDYKLGVKWVINATDPSAVFFDRTKLGVDWGYGEMEAAVLEVGKMVNKVITFPTMGLVVYDSDGGYYANNNGAFELDLNL